MAGQLLPNRNDCSLVAATPAFKRLDHKANLPDSNPDDRAALSPSEVHTCDQTGSSVTKEHGPITKDKGWVDEEIDDADEAGVAGNSVDKPAFGGASTVVDVAAGEDTSHKRPDVFPEYGMYSFLPTLEQSQNQMT